MVGFVRLLSILPDNEKDLIRIRIPNQTYFIRPQIYGPLGI